MDADQSEMNLKVRIQRHHPDMHSLAEDVWDRIAATVNRAPLGCHYFNPAVTVSCPRPSPEFFRIVRREQAKWCRQTNTTFPRRARRRASNWVSGGEVIRHKFGRYLDRALCFTGLLIIDGRLVPHHKWPKATTPLLPQHSLLSHVE